MQRGSGLIGPKSNSMPAEAQRRQFFGSLLEQFPPSQRPSDVRFFDDDFPEILARRRIACQLSRLTAYNSPCGKPDHLPSSSQYRIFPAIKRKLAS
jgi:hypothetical protein